MFNGRNCAECYLMTPHYIYSVGPANVKASWLEFKFSGASNLKWPVEVR